MVESRCGIRCSECTYREEMNCEGCLAINKPFWGDSCPVKDCCEARGHKHCGQCADFPCSLLIDFAYGKEEGDNGKRIETCRAWAAQENLKKEGQSRFDPEKFIDAVIRQDADALPVYFAEDAVIYWHDSNEQLNVGEYIRANCVYPGAWKGGIERLEKTESGLVLVYRITSGEGLIFLVTAFITLAGGKIQRMDEYFSPCGEAPQWRQEMKLGKPIVEGQYQGLVGI